MRLDRRASLELDPDALGAATDLYELTMMAGYQAQGVDQSSAVFELFVRRLPAHRSYLVFAGLEQALDALVNLRFNPDQIAALKTWPVFAQVAPDFFERLASFQFTGNVWSIPEGTVFFANEPVLRVEAPLAQAQLVETLLLGTLGYPISVASKAARIVGAAQGRGLIEFGARRGHGLQASMIAARSAYLAGFLGTSQVEAARRLQIPAFGTMAHSWVQTFNDEVAAFEAFTQSFPNSTLLVDTYDTQIGVRRAASIEPPIRAVRIDSGDLFTASTQARLHLDEANRREVLILASSDLDEYQIAELIDRGAPIDEFGVGTELITCGDAPALSLVYKLCEVAGQGKIKLSAGKRSFPFAKQIYRQTDSRGYFSGDRICRVDETSSGTPLLNLVLEGGLPVGSQPTLADARANCRSQLACLSPEHRSLNNPPESFPVAFSKTLIEAGDRLASRLRSGS